MDLIKCPECGEMYSSSYPRCPFCEEDGEDLRKRKRTPKRRVNGRQAAQSARGGLIVVLVLVLALLGWYLFGSDMIRKEPTPPDAVPPPEEESVETLSPGSDTAEDTTPAAPDEVTAPDETAPIEETTPPEETAAPQETTPPVEETAPPVVETPSVVENVDVSNAKISRTDFTLSREGEQYTIKLSGTEATPTWIVDNPNVATITANGTVTAVANGDTKVHCKVGERDLTCMVRVRGTGKKAEPASAPMVATSGQPAQTPQSTSNPNHVDASTLKVKTNLTGVLPIDPDSGEYDCTVSIGGDVIRLIVVGADGKAMNASWVSGDSSVATISTDGTVTPVQSRRWTMMTATVGDAKINCIIRVR